MIKSMTGFGRAKYEKDLREYSIEIRTVNHKYNDISIKMPRSLAYLEDTAKKAIQNSMSRGKIEVYVSYTNTSSDGKDIKINTELAKSYIEELKKLVKETNIADNINIMDITRLPDVLSIQNTEDTDNTIEEELKVCLSQAIESLLKMRENEGNEIAEDLKRRINSISKKIDEISSNSTGLVEEYIVKLEARIKDLLKTDTIDQSRLAQEVVIFSDKCSIEEELTRLRSHIVQFVNLLDSNSPIGKKLDFIVQEMNRETNTIGSKANNLEITKLVIDIKTEIENVREQIQNLE